MYKIDEKSIKYYGNIDDFDYLPLIGCGTRGNIYEFKVDDSMYALKVFNENLCDTAGSKYYQSDYERLQKIVNFSG